MEQTLKWDKDISVVIRAVRGKRPECLESLLDRLKRFCDPLVSFHGEGRSMADSYCDAWSLGAGRRAGWVCQFEDDAILGDEFEDESVRLMKLNYDLRFFSFYSGRRIKRGEVLPSAPVIERLPGSRFLMAQCVVMRRDDIESHNAFVRDFCVDRPKATDPATAAWMKSRRQRYGRSWPSLVQHSDVPSLYGHSRNPNRFSESFRG